MIYVADQRVDTDKSCFYVLHRLILPDIHFTSFSVIQYVLGKSWIESHSSLEHLYKENGRQADPLFMQYICSSLWKDVRTARISFQCVAILYRHTGWPTTPIGHYTAVRSAITTVELYYNHVTVGIKHSSEKPLYSCTSLNWSTTCFAKLPM